MSEQNPRSQQYGITEFVVGAGSLGVGIGGLRFVGEHVYHFEEQADAIDQARQLTTDAESYTHSKQALSTVGGTEKAQLTLENMADAKRAEAQTLVEDAPQYHGIEMFEATIGSMFAAGVFVLASVTTAHKFRQGMPK